ncbi:MAG: type II toxin-antitoxin system YoeB family toxin [Flavobacteriales bacterium]
MLSKNFVGIWENPWCWSCRINKEHRLVYQVESNIVTVLSAFGHY